MKCYLYSQDLMFSSQVAGAAASANCEFANLRSVEELSAEGQHVVVIDLSPQGLDISQFIASCKSRENVRLIAIGPHVHETKLEAARQAGSDFVLSKGQASRELPTLLRTMAEDR